MQGATAEEQAAPLGTPMVEELLADSFLRKLCTNWLRWITTEASGTVGPVPQPLLEAAVAVATVLEKTLGWNCGPVQELYSDEDDEDGPVVVEGVELLQED